MSIEIKSVGGRVLYVAENAQDVRAAVEAAVAARADLSSADLSYADLSYARLSSADLSSADHDPRSGLFAIRADVWSVLDAAPAEVAGLRAAVADGRIDGTVYQGECACLVGTIAKVRGVDVYDDAAIGLPRNGSRPAEQWFIPIRRGDLPVDLTTLTEPATEGVFRASKALAWIDQWTESRHKIAAALTQAGEAA